MAKVKTTTTTRVRKKEKVRTVMVRNKRTGTGVTVFVPSTKTLMRYGLTPVEWVAILKRQNGVCPVCKKTPQSGKFNTDHDHVPKWRKMPANQRKLHVRGLLCHFCNHYYLSRSITVAKSRNVTSYLVAHEARVKAAESK